MHELYELKEKLLNELKQYSQNGKFSKEDAEVMKYLSSTIDHICNIVMDMEEEEGGSSYRGSSYRGGSSYRNSRAGGESGQSRARGRGRNAKRDSMGRYSSYEGSSRYDGGSSRYDGGSSRYEGGSSRYDGSSYAEGMEEMVESIRGMMGEFPQEVQRDAQMFVQKLEQVM